MRIAVASGKGGTGKTTVATNLAYVASSNGTTVVYIDCDVEEPNGHIFLKPEITSTRPVFREVPQVDPARCTRCGLCGEICQFSAIVPIGTTVLVFPELCHGCGGCARVCPAGAICERPWPIGTLETGHAGAIHFTQGRLNIGEAMSPPLIREAKEASPDADLVLIDAPPGTSCPVIESIREADYVLLVTEPTPFGLHDLKLAVEMVRTLELPFGVILNRTDLGDHGTLKFCRGDRIPILAAIPDDRRIAEAYSRGVLAAQVLPEHQGRFRSILTRMSRLISEAPLSAVSKRGAEL